MVLGNPFCLEGIDFGEYVTHQRQWSVDTLNALETQNSMCNPMYPTLNGEQDMIETTKKIDQTSHHRLHLAFLLPKITILDGIPVSVEEKVAAMNRYAPSLYVIESLRHACVVQRQMKEFAVVKQADNIFRPIVICGPNGAGKRHKIIRFYLFIIFFLEH
jgi:hypothetical protein